MGDVIGYHEIEPAVPIVIDEAGRDAPEGTLDAGLLAALAELALTQVEEQTRGFVFGQDHIGPAVVVDIADGHPHPIPSHVQARPGADVAEVAAGFLPVESVGGPGMRTAVVLQVDVEQAVAVEVEEGSAGARHLRHEMLLVLPRQRTGVVIEFEPDRNRHVLKPAALVAEDERVHGGLATTGERTCSQQAEASKPARRGGAGAASTLPRFTQVAIQRLLYFLCTKVLKVAVTLLA